jgi:glycosyltransferase involved in cell wall biosynthesis
MVEVGGQPLVSVLLPVRDAAPTLGACLDSLLAQTLGDIEILAVDDGSRDSSGEELRRAARHDPRVVVLQGTARGLVAALNLGLASARAPLLARMDADDLAHPDRLQAQARRLHEDRGVDVLGSAVELLEDPALAAPGMRAYVAWQNTLLDHDAIVREMFVESPLVHPSVMLRTAALRDLGGYREIPGPEDYDLWLRALGRGLRFAKLEDVLLRWRDSPRRLTRTDPRYAPDRFRELKIAALEEGPLSGGREVVVWGAGPIGKAWARALGGAAHRVAAFVEVDGRKIGGSIHGAPVLAVHEAGLMGPLHLAAVGQKGARGRIREAALRLGLREGRDFVAVA